MVEPVPTELAGRIVPYLMNDGAAAAIDFYRDALGATERYRMTMPDGPIGHAEIEVRRAEVYQADAPDDMPGAAAHPKRRAGSTALRDRHVQPADEGAD